VTGVVEGMRWRVTKAVRASDLPAPSRLIMLVLADVAEVGTAEIPERFTPSLAVLARETGLDRSTVQRHLAALDTAGWMVRTRPTPQEQWEGERTRYRLTIPAGHEAPGVGAEDTQGVGAEDTHPGRTVHPGVGAENDGGRRTVRHQKTDPSDQEQITKTSSSRAQRTTRTGDEPTRVDVEQICRHLADRIEKNGSKRPAIGKGWRDAGRLLLDKDGRTVEQVLRAIDWCQDDEFWRGNIMSMPKLREKYDQLRLQAQRARASPGTAIVPAGESRPSTADLRVADGMALYHRLKAEGGPDGAG